MTAFLIKMGGNMPKKMGANQKALSKQFLKSSNY